MSGGDVFKYKDRAEKGSKVIKHRIPLSAYTAYALLGMAAMVCFYSSAAFIEFCLIGGGVLAVSGLVCCLFTPCLQKGARGKVMPFLIPASIFSPKKTAFLIGARVSVSGWERYKPVLGLFIAQGSVIVISFAFFALLETQSQLNARLHAIEIGYIHQVLQKNILSLGIIPWMLCSILGVGLAYLNTVLGKPPILSKMLMRHKNKKIRYFLRSAMMIATDVISMLPFVVVVSFAMLWFCDIISIFFGWGSIFLTPMRTTFIAALVILVFRKSNTAFILWRDQYRVSVAKTMLIYILVFSIIFLWLNGSAIWFGLGRHVAGEGEAAGKSMLAGYFSEQSLETKITYLIWGWWNIWTPWLASVVARASLGLTPRRALLQAVIVPLFLLGGMVNGLPPHTWEAAQQWFSQLPIQIGGFTGLLLFIGISWRKMYTMDDIARGAMSSILPVATSAPLKPWMTFFTLWLGCCIPGWLILGWLPLQIMLSLAGFFMILLAALFIGAWGASLFRRAALKKYTAQALP